MRAMTPLLVVAWLVVLPLSGHSQQPPASPSPSPVPPAAPKTPPATDSVQPAPVRPVGSVSELMVHLIYPYSDAVFYVTTRTPATDAAWADLQAKTLALAESANLLMLPGRARDQGRWMDDAKLMLEAGTTAYQAARRKDVAALDALSDQLMSSCITCHQDYRPTYRRRQ